MSAKGKEQPARSSAKAERKVRSVYFFISLLFFTLSFLCIHCRSQTTRKPLVIGVIKNAPGQLLVSITEQIHAWRDAGLAQVTIRGFYSSKQLYRALNEGQIQAGSGELFDTLRAITAGELNGRILSPVSYHGYGLLVRKDALNLPLRELLKKKWAVFAPGYQEYRLIEKLAAKKNLSLSDLHLSFIEPRRAAQTLKSGEVDCVITSEPFLSRIMKDDSISLYLLSEKILYHHVHSVLFISPQTLEKRRDCLKPLLYGLFEASNWIDRNQDKVLERAIPFFSAESSLAQKRVLTRFLYSARSGFPNVTQLATFCKKHFPQHPWHSKFKSAFLSTEYHRQLTSFRQNKIKEMRVN